MKRRLICRICEPEEVSLDTRPDVRVLIVLWYNLDSFLLEKFPPEFRETSLIVTEWLSWAKRTPFLRDYPWFFFRSKKNFYGLDGPIGLASDHLAALRRCAKELCAACAEYTDLLFLTSFDLESLFPYFALKDIAKQRLHLWCAPPLDFFGKHKCDAYLEMARSFGDEKSLLCFDLNSILRPKITFREFFDEYEATNFAMLPHVLRGISALAEQDGKFLWDMERGCFVPREEPACEIVSRLVPRVPAHNR